MNADPRPLTDQACHLHLQATDQRRQAERWELLLRTAAETGPDPRDAHGQQVVDNLTGYARQLEDRAAGLLGFDRWRQRRTLEWFALGDRAQTALAVENATTPELLGGQVWDANAAIGARADHALIRAADRRRVARAQQQVSQQRDQKRGVADRER